MIIWRYEHCRYSDLTEGKGIPYRFKRHSFFKTLKEGTIKLEQYTNMSGNFALVAYFGASERPYSDL